MKITITKRGNYLFIFVIKTHRYLHIYVVLYVICMYVCLSMRGETQLPMKLFWSSVYRQCSEGAREARSATESDGEGIDRVYQLSNGNRFRVANLSYSQSLLCFGMSNDYKMM